MIDYRYFNVRNIGVLEKERREKEIKKAKELRKLKGINDEKSVIDVYFSKPRTEDLENTPMDNLNKRNFFQKFLKQI